jgi:isoamylase
VNYWGYNTLGFFAPHAAYATAEAQAEGPEGVLRELRGAIDLLHEAGIEVLLDVVYNHTCEGGQDGLHLSWRGLDNTGYYLHDGSFPARLADVTGTGNSLDFRRTQVIGMTLDSLRYWVQEIGVDGFRFDLAVTLGRGRDGFDPFHPFLVALQTDPVLRGVKLVAELSHAQSFEGGRHEFAGEVTLESSGAFGYTVRIVPQHPALASTAETGLVTNA